jgi:hypothetical protein
MKADSKTKHPDSHFVSHETPQHQPVPVDEKHASIEQRQPDPLIDTQDGAGVLSGHSQQADQAPEDIGGEAERDTNKTKVAERHITSEPGLKVAESRHAHVRSNRKESEKLFAKTEDGAKRRQ